MIVIDGPNTTALATAVARPSHLSGATVSRITTPAKGLLAMKSTNAERSSGDKRLSANLR